MSLYNVLFGVNSQAQVLLAVLGLTPDTVGRFRDAWLDGNHIVIHTRNGGGNRECSCADEPKWGRESCRHHVIQEEEDVFAFMAQRDWPIVGGMAKAPGNFFYSKDGVFGCDYRSGERRMADRYVCDAPWSVECGCTGCIINYRLPRHPQYVSDADDDFDSTYADVRFSFPPEYASDLAIAASAQGAPIAPSEKWQDLLRRLS